MPDQWAMYMRIKPGKQEHDTSLEEQELRCRRAAKELGFRCEPKHIWREVTDSTSTGEPVLTLVWKAVKNGDVSDILVELGVGPRRNTECPEFGAVAVCSSGPNGENPLETVAAFRRMQEAGIRVHFVDSLWGIPFNENVVTRLRIFMLPEKGDPNEPEQSPSTRRRNGITEAPYGYDLDPVAGNWIINEHEAQGVRLMFRLAGEGKPSREIADALNSAGFRTKRGLLWNKTHVAVNLRKQVHTGVQMLERVPVEGAVPRIIPQDLFDRVQRTLDDRRAADRYRDPSFLLNGFLKCGHCHGPLVQSPRRGGPRHYRCGGKGAACHNPAAGAALLEREVWNVIHEAILNPDQIMGFIRLAGQGDEQDMGTDTGDSGDRREEKEANPGWRKAVAARCRRLARNADCLDREGKRHLLKELGVKVTVSGSEEELLITVDAVFDATRNADSED